ncbi:alpha/beta hydrolase [Chelatococcus sp. SYSU_G07232]|uniref:Alpha/beta hydrolase n=1 Tax=Chelatococcus albus TaxID=3047466 RepID=A0ABT7AGD9_9HYPH|nr:alpha/beta hydrolase [Chelatococcus sp. SYSU_G07232]MDJ1158429.1 alpha/beta hydrolase [Chelatococcus sp. SYSU_G07232]
MLASPLPHLLRSVVVAALVAAVSGLAEAATAPTQPKNGPGGADYAAGDVIKRAYGSGSAQAFVFHAAERSSAAKPVVVFLHAWGAVDPQIYGGWIDHLVRKGLVVVYPRYQESGGKTMTADVTSEAAKGIRQALAALEAEGVVKHDLSHVAFVGHAAGAIIAANLAALAEGEGVPRPLLVMGAMPARAPVDAKTRGVPLADLATLAPGTMLVMVTGDRDTVAGDGGARQIIRAAGAAVGPDHRLLVRLPSDNHGQPPLVAGHYAAAAPNPAYDLAKIEGAVEGAQPRPAQAKAAPRDKAAREQARRNATEQWFLNRMEQQELQMLALQGTDGMDWYGLWKTFDLAREVAFAGRDVITLKRDARLYEMGLWSDGWPVRRLSVESPKPAAPKAEVPGGDTAAAAPATAPR